MRLTGLVRLKSSKSTTSDPTERCLRTRSSSADSVCILIVVFDRSCVFVFSEILSSRVSSGIEV